MNNVRAFRLMRLQPRQLQTSRRGGNTADNPGLNYLVICGANAEKRGTWEPLSAIGVETSRSIRVVEAGPRQRFSVPHSSILVRIAVPYT